MRAKLVARKIGKLVAAAGIVGLGLGLGLSEVRGDGRAGPLLPATTGSPERDAEPPRREREQRSSAGANVTPARRSPRVRVLSAELTPAGSASGRARRRARLAVRVSVTNRNADPLRVRDRVLVVGEQQLGPDPNASEALGALRNPIPRGRAARGELRFETAGGVTDNLTRTRRASVRVVGQTVVFRFEIGEPAEAEASAAGEDEKGEPAERRERRSRDDQPSRTDRGREPDGVYRQLPLSPDPNPRAPSPAPAPEPEPEPRENDGELEFQPRTSPPRLGPRVDVGVP